MRFAWLVSALLAIHSPGAAQQKGFTTDQKPDEGGGSAVHSVEAGGVEAGGKAEGSVGPKSKSESGPHGGRATSSPTGRPAAPASSSGESKADPSLPHPQWDPGEGVIPPGTSCPYDPGGLSGIGLVVHVRMSPTKIRLDSTPKVCNRQFCSAVGKPGWNCCPAGPHGDARVSCELYLLGVDPSDGRPGPHWMFQGAGTIKKLGNPFLADVRLQPGGSGIATVCSNRRPVVCNSIRLP